MRPKREEAPVSGGLLNPSLHSFGRGAGEPRRMRWMVVHPCQRGQGSTARVPSTSAKGSSLPEPAGGVVHAPNMGRPRGVGEPPARRLSRMAASVAVPPLFESGIGGNLTAGGFPMSTSSRPPSRWVTRRAPRPPYSRGSPGASGSPLSTPRGALGSASGRPRNSATQRTTGSLGSRSGGSILARTASAVSAS